MKIKRQHNSKRNVMVSSMVLTSLPPPTFKYFSCPIQRSPYPLDKKHHVSPPPPPPSTLFLEQRSLFLDLLTSSIKPFKTSDFSKHVSLALARWYYYWKHSQRYHNKVNHKHKSFCTSYIRVNSVKRYSQACITYVIRTTMILNCVKKSWYSKY